MIRTILQAKVTKNAAFSGVPLDVSAMANAAVKLRIDKLTATKSVNFVFYAASGADFTTKYPVLVKSFRGEIADSSPVTVSWSKHDLDFAERAAIGRAEGKLRLDIEGIEAGASVDYQAWIES